MDRMLTYTRPRRVFSLALVLLVVVLVPSFALAAGLPDRIVPCGSSDQSACTICDLAKLAQNILNAAIWLAVIFSAILFAWAGFLYLTNVGNPGGISKAKEVFTNVFIGLVIIVAAWLVIDILMRMFLGASLLPWSSIC